MPGKRVENVGGDREQHRWPREERQNMAGVFDHVVMVCELGHPRVALKMKVEVVEELPSSDD